MRGDDRHQGSMFSYRSLEGRIRAEHPLRAMRTMVDAALEQMGPLFEGLYESPGRLSIPLERLLRALSLQILFTVRSERPLMENRHGLVVDARLTQADGYAERETALKMVGDLPEGPPITLGAERGYGTQATRRARRGANAWRRCSAA